MTRAGAETGGIVGQRQTQKAGFQAKELGLRVRGHGELLKHFRRNVIDLGSMDGV